MGNNICIPFSGYIPGGINFGTDVLISGIPHPNCNKFSFNLCAGPTWDSDTAMHFNPRFQSMNVVRNHKQSGSWGLEETNGRMPFNKGQTFEFHLKCEQQGYKITVNNHHFCNFHHRIPKEKVQYLYIEGEVSITYIQFKGQGGKTEEIGKEVYLSQEKGMQKLQISDFEYSTGNVAPPPYPGLPSHPSPAYPGIPGYPTPSYPGIGLPSYPFYPGAAYVPPIPAYPSYPAPAMSGGPLYNPPVPLMTPIPGGMQPGRMIYISGIPKSNPGRFTVNLACGPNDSADFGLHFDPRFKFGSTDRNVVVRTHKQNGHYGPEERSQNYFPFTPGVNFEMMILAEQACYKIAVNNQHFTEFYHRIHPLQRVEYLNILGDVQLIQIRFQ